MKNYQSTYLLAIVTFGMGLLFKVDSKNVDFIKYYGCYKVVFSYTSKYVLRAVTLNTIMGFVIERICH